jgi:hypothetical protein
MQTKTKNGRAFFHYSLNGYILMIINIILDIVFKLSLSNPKSRYAYLRASTGTVDRRCSDIW